MRDIFLIKEPRITEKASDLQAAGQYVFVVKPTATKPEVAKAVKDLYHVDAVAVNIVNVRGKVRRYRGLPSPRTGMKKAIVTLKKGQTIDLGR